MKNFNKILMAMLVATATLLTSCIDNKVAPEVTQLRAAQVAMANAKVSLQLLQNEAQRIANEYQEAINDLDVLQATAEVETAVKEAEVALQEAELALEIALQDLKEYLFEQNLLEAAEFLAKYEMEIMAYLTKSADVYEQEAFVARLGLLTSQAVIL